MQDIRTDRNNITGSEQKYGMGGLIMANRFGKFAALGMTTAIMVSALAGCGGQQPDPVQEKAESQMENAAGTDNSQESEAPDQAADGQTLEVEVIYTGEPLEQFRGIMDDFTAQTGIGIELVTPGSDYEAVMKTRMASGEMPDVFVTHGWSIARYKEYLTPLTGEAWYGRIDESILSVISDDNEEIYVLPITQEFNGIVYNKTVLEKAGVKAEEIRTMEDFKTACEKVKNAGVDPIHIGGKDTWTAAVLYNAMAPAFYTAQGCRYPSGDALKDGSFDWDANGSYVLAEIAEMVQKGYFNADLITADDAATLTAIGEGTAAFNTDVNIAEVVTIVPEAQLGIMPIPSTSEDGKSEYMIGEGSCFGIWKDTEKMDAAKQLLDYLAEPETATRVMEADGGLPALEGMNTENVTYKAFVESQSAFEGDIYYDNLFDREYFPTGMFNAMGDAVIEVFMDPGENGVNAGMQQLKTNYLDKYGVLE